VTENEHWVYVALAYGCAFAIVGLMVWRVVSEHWRLSAELKRLQNVEGERR